MDEQTQTSSQPEESQPEQVQESTTTEEPQPEESTNVGVEEPPPTEEVPPQIIEEFPPIDTEMESQPTFQTIEVKVFGEAAELRIIHQATVGELLVSFLLILAISTFCLRWFFQAVWRR